MAVQQQGHKEDNFIAILTKYLNIYSLKAPGGGGFGAELFSLKYLYQQWLARKNIWTKSNDYKDLVRYTGSVIKLYRHPTTDFVVYYNRQPPFLIEKDYYNDLHPANYFYKNIKKLFLA